MQIQMKFDPTTKQLACKGVWDLASVPSLDNSLQKIPWPKSGEIRLDGSTITKMDTAGAWLLNTWIQKLSKLGLSVKVENLSPQHQALLTIVEKRSAKESMLPKIIIPNWLARFGKSSYNALQDLLEYLSFIGKLTFEALRVTRHLSRIRWNSLTAVIDNNGLQALPIIGLLSFMIGVVIAYQMGIQLRNYGANIFIVNLLGLSVLREFGPLITAIMVAGRTGSAFTAQLGIMKINQEIDALDTMGVTPSELLLLPRIFGLVIALPLLTMWADIFGVMGGMMMANNMLDITWYDFLRRFQHEIPVRALLIGLGKAPVFALIIASIGCYQGMRVQGSADSIGKNTTRSVVLGIFFIIVADAIFSIIFSKLKL